MRKQIHHDLQTKLDVLQRTDPKTIGSELALFASYWKMAVGYRKWQTADYFFQKDFNSNFNDTASPYNDLLKLYPANLTASSKVQNKSTAYENAIVTSWKIKPPQLQLPAWTLLNHTAIRTPRR